MLTSRWRACLAHHSMPTLGLPLPGTSQHVHTWPAPAWHITACPHLATHMPLPAAAAATALKRWLPRLACVWQRSLGVRR